MLYKFIISDTITTFKSCIDFMINYGSSHITLHDLSSLYNWRIVEFICNSSCEIFLSKWVMLLEHVICFAWWLSNFYWWRVESRVINITSPIFWITVICIEWIIVIIILVFVAISAIPSMWSLLICFLSNVMANLNLILCLLQFKFFSQSLLEFSHLFLNPSLYSHVDNLLNTLSKIERHFIQILNLVRNLFLLLV